MKRIHKTWIIGTLAAGLLISGGFVLQHNQAFANDTNTTPTPKKFQDKHSFERHQAPRGGFDFGKGGGIRGVIDFSSILGMDKAALKAEIDAGKTLVQIAQEKANLSEDALLAKLTEAETKKIDTALSEGKIKQEQADKLKEGLADRLKKIVEAKPHAMNFDKKPIPRGGNMPNMPMPGGIGVAPKEIAAILGITEEELATERKAGKSLAEIAAAKGLTEDQLIAKVKDSLTDELKNFVERKGGGERPAPPQLHGDGGSFKGKPGHGGERRPAPPSPSPVPSAT
jgi:ribosomal protein S20